MGRLIDTSELAKQIALQKKRFGNLLEVPICNVFADMIRDTPSAKQGVSLEKLDEDAKETVSHLIECYEDGCFTKDERVTLAGIAFQARLRFQLNKYKEREDGNE